MAATLVGAVGAVSQGASGAAVTPAFDADAPRNQGDLLVCLVASQGSATIPSTPAGWNAPKTQAGTSCAVALFTKVATGGDAAPTIALVTGAVLSAQLMEFSGVRPQTAADRAASIAGTASPLVATNAFADDAAGELLIYVSSAFYSVAGAKTLTSTLNNGTVANDTNNNATSTVNHYGFGWGTTGGKSAADSDSFAYTTLNITGAALAIASFKLAWLPAPPSYLPRALGPPAGPSFLAAFQQAQPGPQPAVPGVWLPAETFPAQRNRVFASVRGRRTVVVQAQEAPIVARRPAPLPRDLFALAARGRRTLPVPAQVNPPYPWPNRLSPGRSKHTMLRRGARTWPVAAQQNPPYPRGNRSPAARRLTPPARGRQWSSATMSGLAPVALSLVYQPWSAAARTLAHLTALRRGRRYDPPWTVTAPAITWPPPRTGRLTRLTALRRGTRTFVIPAQQNPPFVRPNQASALRSKFAMLRKGRQWTPVPKQLNPPYPWTVRSPAIRRIVPAARGRQAMPTPAPQTVILTWPPPRTARAAKLLALRRGSRSGPTPPQQNPPYVRHYRRPAGRRYFTVQRGHTVTAAWFRVPIVAPAPPCITPPTLASILPYDSSSLIRVYTSAAAVSAYTSTAQVRAYSTTALPKPYSASAGIVAYSTTPGLITYTSDATFGPRFCP